MEALLTPFLGPEADPVQFQNQLNVVRTFISGRRDELLSERATGDPEWTVQERNSPCFTP